MSQTGEPALTRAHLGPDHKSKAMSVLRAAGSDCTEHTSDEPKKRASTTTADIFSDQGPEQRTKLIKQLRETRDKAAKAKAAVGTASEDNDSDAVATLDLGAFGVLVVEQPTGAGGASYISLVDLSTNGGPDEPPLENPAVLTVLCPLEKVPEDCEEVGQNTMLPVMGQKDGLANSAFAPGAIYKLRPEATGIPGHPGQVQVQVQVTQIEQYCGPALYQDLEDMFDFFKFQSEWKRGLGDNRTGDERSQQPEMIEWNMGQQGEPAAGPPGSSNGANGCPDSPGRRGAIDELEDDLQARVRLIAADPWRQTGSPTGSEAGTTSQQPTSVGLRATECDQREYKLVWWASDVKKAECGRAGRAADTSPAM